MKFVLGALALVFSLDCLAQGFVVVNPGYGYYGGSYVPVYATPIYAAPVTTQVQTIYADPYGRQIDRAEYDRQMADWRAKAAQPGSTVVGGTVYYYPQNANRGYGTLNETRNYYGNVNSTGNYYGNTNFTNNYNGITNGTLNLNGPSNLTINGNPRSNITVNGGNVRYNR